MSGIQMRYSLRLMAILTPHLILPLHVAALELALSPLQELIAS